MKKGENKKGENKKCETTNHFSMIDHTTEDMEIITLKENETWTETERLQQEDYFISLLKTKHPHGLNKKTGELAQYFYDIF